MHLKIRPNSEKKNVPTQLTLHSVFTHITVHVVLKQISFSLVVLYNMYTNGPEFD